MRTEVPEKFQWKYAREGLCRRFRSAKKLIKLLMILTPMERFIKTGLQGCLGDIQKTDKRGTEWGKWIIFGLKSI